MSDKDGGPAFPVPDTLRRDLGMTLRDYFAAAAIGGMFASDTDEGVMRPELKAQLAYEISDKMLKEREK